MTSASIDLDLGTITKNLRLAPRQLDRLIEGTMQRKAVEAENWMKINAPWQDQTSNARNGLAARYQREGGGHSITLFHQVPYGLWLEVRFEGRLAIVGPAVAEFGPRTMQALEGALNDVGR